MFRSIEHSKFEELNFKLTNRLFFGIYRAYFWNIKCNNKLLHNYLVISALYSIIKFHGEWFYFTGNIIFVLIHSFVRMKISARKWQIWLCTPIHNSNTDLKLHIQNIRQIGLTTTTIFKSKGIIKNPTKVSSNFIKWDHMQRKMWYYNRNCTFDFYMFVYVLIYWEHYE